MGEIRKGCRVCPNPYACREPMPRVVKGRTLRTYCRVSRIDDAMHSISSVMRRYTVTLSEPLSNGASLISGGELCLLTLTFHPMCDPGPKECRGGQSPKACSDQPRALQQLIHSLRTPSTQYDGLQISPRHRLLLDNQYPLRSRTMPEQETITLNVWSVHPTPCSPLLSVAHRLDIRLHRLVDDCCRHAETVQESKTAIQDALCLRGKGESQGRVCIHLGPTERRHRTQMPKATKGPVRSV